MLGPVELVKKDAVSSLTLSSTTVPSEDLRSTKTSGFCGATKSVNVVEDFSEYDTAMDLGSQGTGL